MGFIILLSQQLRQGFFTMLRVTAGRSQLFNHFFSLYSGSVLSYSVDLTSTYSFVVLERAKDLFVEAGMRLPFQLFFLLGGK